MTDPFTTASATQPRSPRTIAVDNFLRKTLRVGDPRDPDQIARALLQMYPAEAERVRREADGLAYATFAEPLTAAAAGGGAAMAELAQAQDDLERDARTLVESSQLKDIRIELTGWSRAVRRLADDGLAAARLALDATQFDRAMSARAQLSSYARLARYVGTLNDGAGSIFRRFAQSCDTLGALILVGIGEGLAASGLTRSTAFVRVPAGELQQRRNAVIGALRVLTGSMDAPAGQEDWPRGVEAYRRLADRLLTSGQSDLRVLLEETALAGALDELIDLCAGGSVNNLRELSTAAPILVDRLRRLIDAAQAATAAGGQAQMDSPPLAAFASALLLFVDAFRGSGGARLLYIARPAILVRGLYGEAGPDEGARRLLELTLLRGQLAEQVDCLAGCECDVAALRRQILLDFLLQSLDRAIDAYGVGDDPSAMGDTERRATGFGVLFDAAANATFVPPVRLGGAEGLLNDIAAHLLGSFRNPAEALRKYPDAVVAVMRIELLMTYRAEGDLERLARTLAPACRTADLFEAHQGRSLVRQLIREIYQTTGQGDIDAVPEIVIPPTTAKSLGTLVGAATQEEE